MDAVLARIVELMGPTHGARNELANAIGIHPGIITNWKSGRNRSYRKYLPQIAAHYGVSVEYLVTGQSPEAPKEKPAPQQTPVDELSELSGYERLLLTAIRSLSPQDRENLYTEISNRLAKRRDQGLPE